MKTHAREKKDDDEKWWWWVVVVVSLASPVPLRADIHGLERSPRKWIAGFSTHHWLNTRLSHQT